MSTPIEVITNALAKALLWLVGIVVGVFGGGGSPANTSETVPEPIPTPEAVVAAPAPSPSPTAAPVAPEPTSEPTPAVVAGPTAEQWAQVRWCESNDNYQINTGNGFYGAYQFHPTSWDYAVGAIGLNEWVGVLPHLAPPEVQDAAALSLYHLQGKGAWPVCGRVLP